MYGKTKQSLSLHDLSPTKRLGQNFLVNRLTAEAIVQAGGVHKDDIIIEVGVGLGALTIPLSKAARQVIGLEIDNGIIRLHQTENDLPDNVTLIHEDVLKTDFSLLAEKYGGPLKIMANLPYSISNPFLFKLIDNHQKMAWATIMLQKEVAERLMAEPDTKLYGVPTILLQSCATVKPLMTLPPREFHPRPKIDSIVVRIDFNNAKQRINQQPEYRYNIFKNVVRSAFSQRRKTLLNALASNLFVPFPHINKAEAKELTARIIECAGISPGIRAENLLLEDFIRLAIAADRSICSVEKNKTQGLTNY
jgi:16S rRNA (adenine1518-N6/adenine1519-N6)-dimethyltransferase